MSASGLPKATGQRGQPTRIGAARPSHLVTTGGVGAVLDLPNMSVVVRGLERWGLERAEAIEEPRLLAQVRAVLGEQVRALRSAPWDPSEADDSWSRTGAPVSPFPRWVRCPRCHRLGPLDPPGQFELIHRSGRRPDLAKWVHSHCARQTQTSDGHKRACLPARFLVACDAGHLDDFPYVDFVHHGATQACLGPKLTMRDSGSTLGPRVTVSCAECGASRNIQAAAGRDGWEALPACRGRHPHLQRFDPCGKPLRLMVLGASNLWFSVTASALHLPHDQTIGDVVLANWELLSALPSALLASLIDGMPALRALREVAVEEVWAVIEKLRAEGGAPAPAAAGDLLAAEWALLARPTTEHADADFRAQPTAAPGGYEGLLDQVVLVTRLREVQALLGFTRLSAPERRDLAPAGRLPISRSGPTWVPAFEQRGEGVFLQLPEPAVRAWVDRVDEHPRIQALRAAYWRWAANRDRPANPDLAIPRLVLLHTLSHLLIRQAALECGYSSSSIRERLYLGSPPEPAAGILLSTAASDSEGTLGGLVALGEPANLGRLLDAAFEDGRRCSSDPICAEDVPLEPSDTLHAAACHACLFASETSCETGNRWLDRAVLVDLTGDGLAFLAR